MDVDKHIQIATERASTRPEVATANALAAIAILLKAFWEEEND